MQAAVSFLCTRAKNRLDLIVRLSDDGVVAAPDDEWEADFAPASWARGRADWLLIFILGLGLWAASLTARCFVSIVGLGLLAVKERWSFALGTGHWRRGATSRGARTSRRASKGAAASNRRGLADRGAWASVSSPLMVVVRSIWTTNTLLSAIDAARDNVHSWLMCCL